MDWKWKQLVLLIEFNERMGGKWRGEGWAE